MSVIERKVQEIGKSLLITLPKDWTKALKVKKGSKIKIVISKQGNLLIAPEFTKKEISKETTISLDEKFPRRFFKEYFEGNEKITILLKENTKSSQRKEMYAFLKKFMNIQIIEETKNKVVVKCFKIEDLTIEECLKRMFFLSINMIDEVSSSNDKMKINEMENTLTKFYYMLVMQIRRFLSEGKFTKQNQISLTKALDFRMIGEKIERIADILKSFKNLKNKEFLFFLTEIKDYYSKAFNHFINNNYEKALSMMSEERKKKNKYEKIKNNILRSKNILAYKQITDLFQILTYSREISMLIRN